MFPWFAELSLKGAACGQSNNMQGLAADKFNLPSMGMDSLLQKVPFSSQ